MTDRDPFQVDAFQVDVRDLLSRTVANLYSHLVTRPTGRAVRIALEAQLRDQPRPVLSLVDFSSVAILDFSCADEVVAKLLLALREEEGGDAFVLFRGVREYHREPIEAVLERHGLRAVAQVEPGTTHLMGPASPGEAKLWSRVEEAGRLSPAGLERLLSEEVEGERTLEVLLRHRLVFRHPLRGDLFSLTALSRELGPTRGQEDRT